MKAEPADSQRSIKIYAGRFRLSPKLKGKIQMLAERIINGERKSLNASLIFIGDARMQELNRRFKGKSSITDVLSFPLGANGKKADGEIYLSIPQARRQAPLFSNQINGEILRLTAHGVLHLLGYDHHTIQERTEMFVREERYLKGLEATSSRGEKC